MPVPTVKVILKGEDWTFTKKYIIYDEIIMHEDTDKLAACIKDARECLKISADDCEIKSSMLVR